MQLTIEELDTIAYMIEINESFKRFKGRYQSKHMRPMVLFNEITFWKYAGPPNIGSTKKEDLNTKNHSGGFK